jgi:hypothetical protein
MVNDLDVSVRGLPQSIERSELFLARLNGYPSYWSSSAPLTGAWWAWPNLTWSQPSLGDKRLRSAGLCTAWLVWRASFC